MAAVESIAKEILFALISKWQIIFLQITGLLTAEGNILIMCF
jgi:hypothetical protein